MENKNKNNNVKDRKQKSNASKQFSNQSDGDVVVPTVSEQHKEQPQQIIPVLEEEYSISKETIVKEAKIEKRWVTKTKSIKVPILYEEIYINDKKMKSMEEPQILSLLKDKIISSIGKKSDYSSDQILFVKQSDKKSNKSGGNSSDAASNDDKSRGELVPLMYSSSPSDNNNRNNISETEKVIPIFTEEFEIKKKMVKVAEIVLRKRKVTEKKKFDIDIIKEQVTIKYPDEKTEKLS